MGLWPLLGLAGLGLVVAWPRAARAELPPSKVAAVNGRPIPRGIRNHNPFNLRPGDPWRGLASPSVDDGPGGGYLIFQDAHHGLRAGFINLANQQLRHRLRTVRSIITKYAPASDDNDTAAYIASVAAQLGVGPDQELDLVRDRAQLEAFGRAVIRHENGIQPYGAEQLAAALGAALASVAP